MVQRELLQPSILGSGFELDSVGGSDLMVDFEYVVVSMVGSEFAVESDFASSTSSILGILAGSKSVHSTIEVCFQPSILQSVEGNFQHYAR